MLPWLHTPRAAVHDEFSYLLAADTYASGRLANPPHRFWQHFESFHILQQPTYASKYQPMQGMVLAVGQKLFGDPWIGVWMSTGLMCAAICWMLQGWISLEMALLGALLVTLRIGILSYWMNSYWGGAVPAIGGALMLGALGRIIFQKQFRHAATLGIGIAILFNSRPYDGFVLALVCGCALLWWLVRRSEISLSTAVKRIALPIAGVLVAAGAFTLYNNYRVTGNPLELPYQAHDRQYTVVSMLAWSAMHPEPLYRHAVMQKFWARWNVDSVNAVKANLLNAFLEKMSLSYTFLLGLYPLLVPPLIWPYPLKTIQERMTVFLLAACLLALWPVTGFAPHYIAAMMGLIYLRFLQALSRLGEWKPLGKPIGFAVAVFFLMLIPCQLGLQLWGLWKGGEYAPQLALSRDQVIQTLEDKPGRHVVLVRYSPNHDVHAEWVYNRADIDAQQIVWAREMGPEQDRPFVEYFHDRSVWLLEPDRSPPQLLPYQQP